jgi:transposase
VELSKMERRHDAVLGAIRDGNSVQEVAEAYGVSRQSMHTWLARYESGGLPVLADRSHRPSSSPLLPATVESGVLELRPEHPAWGQITLRRRLETEGVTPLSSASAVYRVLLRHGLIEAQ